MTWKTTLDTTNKFNVRHHQESAVAIYAGAGEFYTGLSAGTAVRVLRDTYTHENGNTTTHYYASHIDGGAWLSLSDPSVLHFNTQPTL